MAYVGIGPTGWSTGVQDSIVVSSTDTTMCVYSTQGFSDTNTTKTGTLYTAIHIAYTESTNKQLYYFEATSSGEVINKDLMYLIVNITPTSNGYSCVRQELKRVPASIGTAGHARKIIKGYVGEYDKTPITGTAGDFSSGNINDFFIIQTTMVDNNGDGSYYMSEGGTTSFTFSPTVSMNLETLVDFMGSGGKVTLTIKDGNTNNIIATGKLNGKHQMFDINSSFIIMIDYVDFSPGDQVCIKLNIFEGNTTAHKVKKGYVGVKTDIPIYEEQTTTGTVNITNSNLSEYFTVTNGSSYWFKWDSSTSKFVASGVGAGSSSSTTTLKAKKAINNFSMNYGYTSEQNYDKFTFTYNSTTVESAVSGTLSSKTWTKNLASGDTLSFTYTKDGSVDASGETCWFGGMTCTDQTIVQVQTGTETKEVARLFFSSGPKIVSWATGTDEEVAAMIQAAHNGEIKLADYWSIGDTRTVSLSAGTNSAGTTIPAQNVELVLAHKPTSTSYYGGGEFIINQKNCLSVNNYMNSSNTNRGSFAGSAMASFLNNTSTGYLKMLPTWLSSVLLDASVITAQTNNGTTNQISTHKVFLPAAKEVFGGTATSAGNATGGSNLTEFNALEQWEWFKTSANRIKQKSDSAYPWWERSPYYDGSDYFCNVEYYDSPSGNGATRNNGVAPAMLI